MESHEQNEWLSLEEIGAALTGMAPRSGAMLTFRPSTFDFQTVLLQHRPLSATIMPIFWHDAPSIPAFSFPL